MLGHHYIGDYFWHSAFEGNLYHELFDIKGRLKEGRRLEGHEEFIEVITYIHESFHLLQDLTLGLPTWLQYDSDSIAVGIKQLANQSTNNQTWFNKFKKRLGFATSSPQHPPLSKNKFLINSKTFRQVEALRNERAFLIDCIYSSHFTDAVLDAEIYAHPNIHGHLEPAYGLTGEDLLECHAAILTERYISWLFKKNPTAYNPVILADVVQFFRVNEIIKCQKVLAVFSGFLKHLNFESANKEHPLFPSCPNAAELGFLLFLLDYALHISPLERGQILPPDIQDAIPTIRFLKILGSITPFLARNTQRFHLDEKYLYSDFMSYLVEFNNQCNQMAGKSPSFCRYGETTNRWLKFWVSMDGLYKQEGLSSIFDDFKDYRLKSLKLMQADPLQVYTSTIHSFAIDIGLNPMVNTNSGIKLAMPYLVDDENGISNPKEVLDMFVKKEVFKAVSESLFTGAVFSCPIATRYTFFPCNNRSSRCESIYLSNIPECCGRQVIREFYNEYIDF